MSLETSVILCECNSAEHQILFRKFTDEPETVYMEVHLSTNRGFWKRLWYGLKYAFGYKSRFGAWDELILSEKILENMQDFLAKETKK